MKRALPIALALALIVSVPALSQDDKPDLEARVQVLEEVIVKQKELLQVIEEVTVKQRKLLESYQKTRDARGAELVRWLDVSEKKGFMFPGANADAKRALFSGLRAIAGPVKPSKAAKK